MLKFEKKTLEGEYVRLEPLEVRHCEGLCKAVSDGELWKLHVTMVPHPDDIGEFFQNAEAGFRADDCNAFATIDRKTGEIAGSTRYMNANLAHLGVEIGFTFLGKSWQRTHINTEAKLLMLAHAFDDLGLNRVEFRTDFLNFKSQKAIERLGAKKEGVLRNQMIMRDGRIRDSVVYSIIRNEWPGVKSHLTTLLEINY